MPARDGPTTSRAVLGPTSHGATTAPEDDTMATYIMLGNFTDQGIKSVKETTHRAEAVEGAARQAGLTLKQIFWTLGEYDLVCTFDAPDDAAMTAFGLTIASQGNVRTQTLRGFDRGEMNAILAKVK
jgi:uncharacterized protein with GYD domain